MVSSSVIDDIHLLVRDAGFPDVSHFRFCMEDEIPQKRFNDLPVILFVLYMISNNDHYPAPIMHKLVVADSAPVHTMPMRGNLGIIRGGLNPRLFTARRLAPYMAF